MIIKIMKASHLMAKFNLWWFFYFFKIDFCHCFIFFYLL